MIDMPITLEERAKLIVQDYVAHKTLSGLFECVLWHLRVVQIEVQAVYGMPFTKCVVCGKVIEPSFIMGCCSAICQNEYNKQVGFLDSQSRDGETVALPKEGMFRRVPIKWAPSLKDTPTPIYGEPPLIDKTLFGQIQ